MGAVPDDIVRLVRQFGAGEKRYTQKGYQELEARSEFIDPLFEALGWDVRNVKGALPDQREVFLENTIRRDDVVGEGIEDIVGKRPDYAFRLEGTRKFYVEAKKPAEALATNSAHAFQVRAYGWSAKLPVSILTDFQELSVYDCRVKPEVGDQAATARLPKGYFTYDQYVERWEEIEGLLGREAVEAGGLEKFAEEKPPRGALTVDASFLRDMSMWREVLARDIAGRNGGLSQQELNYAVQMTINRIIFLRICEDRGIEPQGRLQEAIAARRGGDVREGAVYGDVVRLFKRADERYNSGLFHFVDEKQRSEHADHFTLKLEVGDEAMTEVIRHLYYPFPYKFDVIPIEILGQVYEQFLGKVIVRSGDGGVKVEDKPEVRKAGGVYYTPTYIVDYIVENTVGKMLDGKTPEEVSRLRILDPACGSGSFLIGAYGYLLGWYLRWYTEHEPEKRVGTRRKDGPLQKVKMRVGKDGKEEQGYRLTVEERKRILLNNIYGVDIDTQAVEVTKLSLLLKVLEGEIEGPTQLGLREFGEEERVLPDLGANIKCGNSLIGPDFYTSGQASFLGEDEERRINVFDWERAFPEIMKGGGFDAVIGNPPYIPIESMNEKEKHYYHSRFKQLERKYDSSVIFILAGLAKLNLTGRLGYISSLTWQTGENYAALREYLFTKAGIFTLVNLPFDVFKDAYVDTGVYILSSVPQASYDIFRFPKKARVSSLDSIQYTTIDVNLVQEPDYKVVLEPTAQRILTQRSGKPGYVLLGAITISTQGLAGNMFIRKPDEKSLGADCYPFLEAGQVYRYSFDVESVLFTSMSDYQSLKAFYDKRPKLLARRVINRQDRLMLAYTEQKMVFKKDINPFIVTADGWNIYYLLGTLNSRLISYLYVNTSSIATKDDFRQTTLAELRRIPIRAINFKDKKDKGMHDRMVRLVEGMLELHRRLGEAKTPYEKEGLERRIEAMDGEIDRLVYELYGLTEDEIRVVEGGAR